MSCKNIPPTFYKEIPDGEINIDKVEKAIKIRYALLLEIDKIKNTFSNKIKNIQDNLTDLVQIKFHQEKTAEIITWDNEEGILYDIVSYFILGLFLCHVDSDIQWLCKYEAILFQKRVEIGNYNPIDTLKEMGISLNRIDENLINKNLLEIIKRFTQNNLNSNNEKIYYVPFEKALSLVPTHKYVLHKGNIYIPSKDIIFLIQTICKENTKNNINKIKAHEKYLLNDPRILSLQKYFEVEREHISFTNKDNEINIPITKYNVTQLTDIDIVANDTFPLCMLTIQKHINEYSHLMHLGRLQYTLFLKGIGLPLSETLRYFQKKYERKTSEDLFNKNYAYNIRHCYGQEGKRIDYPPYSCAKINQMNPPSNQECHGCPFKIFTEDKLKIFLSTLKINQINIDTILETKRKNEFVKCCKIYFESKFPDVEHEGIGIHPNKYFISAMEAVELRNKAKKNKIEYESI